MTASPIRLATAADAPAVAAIYAPYVRDTSISFETVAPDTAEMSLRLAAAGDRYPWLVAQDAEAVVGYAYATAHRSRAAYRWSVDVSVYVDLTARRAGWGRRLYAALLDVLTAQGFTQAFAVITLPNDPSIALHRALGFTHAGTSRNVGHKLGRWHDTSAWQRPLACPVGQPPEPRTLPEIDVDTLLRRDAPQGSPGPGPRP